MIKYILSFLVTCSVFAQEYDHPGARSFLDLGGTTNRSAYGYQVYVPHVIAKIVYDRFTLEGFKANYNLIENKFIAVGPMINYTFTPYAGTELSKLHGMKRSGFLDYGVLATIPLPIGQLMLSASQTAGEMHPDLIYKAAYGTGIPLLAMSETHVWLNILLEYGWFPSSLSTYIFGVYKNEENINRKASTISNINYFTSITGLWVPITKKYWLTMTYKFDKYSSSIKKSSIVVRDYEETMMAGLMYSF